MSRSSRGAAAGFSLIEMLVVVACLGMIFWISAQLLFPMRTASERQRLQVEARQTARAAADYMTYVLRGATDASPLITMNNGRNPLAVMTWVVTKVTGSGTIQPGCPGDNDCAQLSYNNVTAASNFGDPGTDVITVGQFEEPIVMLNSRWPGFTSGSPSAWFFEQGCSAYTPPGLPAGDDAENMRLFEEITGRGTDSAHADWSKVMMAYDAEGRWGFFQITSYQDSDNSDTCTSPDPNECLIAGEVRPCFRVIANPGNDAVNSPGGHRTLCGTCDKFLTSGVRFMSFRVCNGWLQQKNGLFNPDTDNNCQPGGNGQTANWTPLLPNVEDMQIAYIFRNGQVFNSAQQTLSGSDGSCDVNAGVPCQGWHILGNNTYDATNILGFRVTVVARSGDLLMGTPPIGLPLSAEDHIIPNTTTRDRIRRHLVSANALIRNRAPMT
ncbi:MAG: type II secretion system GspH family protein [Thermoanaerobaculaceae bacterium]|jgi:prepilin-type N-terminal cleavage/methylation domain-containing protein|nr:type II secretion system GspH family protein [Thermoanaerobaculaceae bacterium]